MQALSNFNVTVSDIVRNDYRTADVFKRFGISYCCGGKISLKEACEQYRVSYNEMNMALEKATKNIQISNAVNYDSWKLEFLADYIVNIHHNYIYQVVPEIEQLLECFSASHCRDYPTISKILKTFRELSQLLITHSRHEEEIIFPYIKQMENTFRRKETYGNLFVRTLRKPLSNIQLEHKKINGLVEDVRELTENYHFPTEACMNHQVLYRKLQELDEDMNQHKYLENSILFPKAIEIEKALLQW